MEYESSASSSLIRELVKGIPITHVYVAVLVFVTIWFYNFLEFHFIHDVVFTFFRGSPISLTFNPASEIYHGVAANCRLLHARYMATPWLASPHVQTTFLNFHGRAPAVEYTRANKNIVLAVTRHGGHLAFFEGLTGSSLWWVRAVNEFLGVLHGSPFMHTQKKNPPHSGLESFVDQGPYVNVANGMVAAISNDPLSSDVVEDPSARPKVNDNDDDIVVPDAEHSNSGGSCRLSNNRHTKTFDLTGIIKWVDQLFLQNRRSTWMLSYIAIMSTLPLLGVALHYFFRRKFNKAALTKSLKW